MGVADDGIHRRCQWPTTDEWVAPGAIQERGWGRLLTPEFGKEYDMWVRFEKESVWWKERYFQRFLAEGSAVGYLLQFGKGTVELILRDWTVTWLDQRKRMDG
jgi:hypothetical protein